MFGQKAMPLYNSELESNNLPEEEKNLLIPMNISCCILHWVTKVLYASYFRLSEIQQTNLVSKTETS
jgi:hypothetical protein